jgi:hypothetical protein
MEWRILREVGQSWNVLFTPSKEGLLNWQAVGNTQSPFIFVNWGLGTGQTVSWVNDHV